MIDFVTQLFDTEDFPPRWTCGNWTEGHGWLHILSDLGVFSAYFAIPIVLAFFVARRKDLPFRRLFVLFAAFILLCGATHLMEAIIFWWPIYRFAGVLKLITAIVSWATVIALVPLVPKILAMRSPEELEREIERRTTAEEALQKSNAELEQRVLARTTDLTTAAAALQDERELLRTTLACIGDGVIVTDREGRVTFLNPVAEDLTGWTAADAKEVPLEEVFRIVNEQTRKTVESPAVRALEEGTIVGLANHTVLISRNGTETPIDDSAAPIRYHEGSIVGCVLVFRDVAERRAAENRILESEERLRFVMDSMPQKIFTARPGGGFDYFNPHWRDVPGLRFDNPGEQEWDHFIHPDDLGDTLRAWDGAITSGETFEVDHRFQLEGGDYRWHVTRAKALKDTSGAVQLWIGSNTDIHNLVETTNELRGVAKTLSGVDRRKNEFIATLAHELRNPLAPLSTGLHLIKEAGHDQQVVDRARAMMERQLAQLIRLVDDLLDVSRISQGKIELRKESVSLETVMQHTIETCSPHAAEYGQEVIVSLPQAPVILHADLTRLTQVFLNLINNAIKYSDPGSRILVTAERVGDEVAVTVKDSGIGIEADFLPHLFEMFAQLPLSAGKTRGGLGIGLSLVKRLVEMHDGRIEAGSEGSGKGAEFRVFLPVATGTAEQQCFDDRDGDAGEAPGSSRAALRILVVDDNRDSTDSLSMILEARGYEIRKAYDGHEALSSALDFRPGVVLLDIGLPGLDGYETCLGLRAQPGGESMVIIAQTGWGQDEDRRLTKEAGFDHHLVKPIDLPGLFRLLGQIR